MPTSDPGESDRTDADRRSAPRAGLLGLVAGLAGGAAATVVAPDHSILSAIFALVVVASVTLVASRPSLLRSRLP